MGMKLIIEEFVNVILYMDARWQSENVDVCYVVKIFVVNCYQSKL